MAQFVSRTARTFCLSIPQARAFSLFPSANNRSHINRLFDNVRQPQDLHTLTLVNAADNRSLITLWSASWCQTCQTVKPLVKQLIEEERVGEREGGLGFVEVEMDSTLIGDLPITYRITSMPTLLAFSRQEAQFDTRLVRPEEMKNKDFLREWLLTEARRGGREGGAGGVGLLGLDGSGGDKGARSA
ncbi:mitochondrial thioredoxin [Stagonosporopsis vannaccii]|nr:mitochondrial thioredoxin [Stagonosporopsis vannaccii]